MQRDSEFLLKAYATFLKVRDARAAASDLPFIDYEQFKFGDQPFRSVRSSIYRRQAESFAREIINDVHGIRCYLEDLRCWISVLAGYSEDDRFYLVLEFLDDRTVLALGRPSAIRWRYIYSTTKLAQLRAYAAPLPDERINFPEMRKLVNAWPGYPEFEHALSAIDGEAYRTATSRFRDLDAHRFPPRINMGLAPAEGITAAHGQITISAGNRDAIPLDLVERVLTAEYPLLIAAAHSFWKLVAASPQTSCRRADS